MIQGDERVLVLGHRTPIGAALLRRLVRLGHPRSHLLTRPMSTSEQPAETSIGEFLKTGRPHLVCLVESAEHCKGIHDSALQVDTLIDQLPPGRLMEIACEAGVEKLIYISTTSSGSGPDLECLDACDRFSDDPEKLSLQRKTDAFRSCARFSSAGLDYRSVLTCEAYGPLWPLPTSTNVGRAARMIEELLHRFRAAEASGVDLVTIKANPTDRIELMFTNDIADAIVHVMDLPRSELESDAFLTPSLLELGAEKEVSTTDLVDAVVAAAGFRGRIVIEAAPPASARRPLTSLRLARLGWRPLIELDTGLELTVMDYRLRQIAKRGSEQAATSTTPIRVLPI